MAPPAARRRATPWQLIPGRDASATVTVHPGPVFDGVHSVHLPGRVLFPLRYVSQAFGCTVTWDDQAKAAVVTLDGKRAVITPGSGRVFVDGVLRIWDLPGELHDGHTYVSARVLTELHRLWMAWTPDRVAIFGGSRE